MSWIAIAIVSFATGIFASLGLGGGMILIVYLTIFVGMEQVHAQGINLIFFIPIAVFSLILHSKNKLIEWKKIIPILITGMIFVIIFSFIAISIDNSILKRIFGIFITAYGLREILPLKKKD